MARKARSEAAEQTWRVQAAMRADALKPLRSALGQDGRGGRKTQRWLIREMTDRVHISIKPSLLSGYLHGRARIPRNVLSAACWIAEVRETDILARIDEIVLLQPAKRTKKRQTASV